MRITRRQFTQTVGASFALTVLSCGEDSGNDTGERRKLVQLGPESGDIVSWEPDGCVAAR